MTSPASAAPLETPSLTDLTAAELAALVATREVSVVEVAQAHLARVGDAEPWVRALVHVDRDDVLDQARRLDVRRRRN